MTEYLTALRSKDLTPFSDLIMDTDSEKKIQLNILGEKDNKKIEEKVEKSEEEEEEKDETEGKDETEEKDDMFEKKDMFEKNEVDIDSQVTTVQPRMESVGEIQVTNILQPF